MKEIWKDVKNYEGLYQVSNLGNVKSNQKILKPNKTHNGYLNVRLYKDNKVKGYGIHRLVAEAFIPNVDNLPQVNHIDGNKKNNNVKNLEWCNAEYNQLHAIKNGMVKIHKVMQYDLNGNFIKEWESIKLIAKHYNTSHVNIVNCCNGKIKTSNNFIWKYKEEF